MGLWGRYGFVTLPGQSCLQLSSLRMLHSEHGTKAEGLAASPLGSSSGSVPFPDLQFLG